MYPKHNHLKRVPLRPRGALSQVVREGCLRRRPLRAARGSPGPWRVWAMGLSSHPPFCSRLPPPAAMGVLVLVHAEPSTGTHLGSACPPPAWTVCFIETTACQSHPCSPGQLISAGVWFTTGPVSCLKEAPPWAAGKPGCWLWGGERCWRLRAEGRKCHLSLQQSPGEGNSEKF